MDERGKSPELVRNAAGPELSAARRVPPEPTVVSAAASVPLTSQSDEDLISLFQTGEEAAFRVLVERYQERVRNLLFTLFREREIVDDLAQDVFLRVYEALPRFRFESSFYTWLYRITVNRGRDELRRRKVRRWLTLHPLSDQHDDVLEKVAAVPPVDGETADLVHRALDSLPEHFRVPVVLKDIEGLSYEEIAAVLQCRIGTVKSRLARGRSMLRTVLKPLLEEK
jgi:RNA polymerase sigma-70 factor (ECF subfamily)